MITLEVMLLRPKMVAKWFAGGEDSNLSTEMGGNVFASCQSGACQAPRWSENGLLALKVVVVRPQDVQKFVW